MSAAAVPLSSFIARPSSFAPQFSIIIPTYNRPRPMHTCLSAIAAQDYPPDRFEVIVVDDGGAIDPARVIDRFRNSLNITLLKQANAGPAAARNTGAAAAAGEYLAFTDDDCAPHRDWLTKLAAELQRQPEALVGGGCVNALPNSPYASATQIILDVIHAHFNREPGRATFFPSDNMAMTRARFQEIGRFDPAFRWSEDRELCDRWSARGWPLVLCPLARIDHARAMGLGGFWRQHIGYGRGAWRFHQTRAQRGTGRLEVDGNFYFECFAEPFRTHPPRKAIPLAAMLTIWQLANTAGFFYEAGRSWLKRQHRRTRPLS